MIPFTRKFSPSPTASPPPAHPAADATHTHRRTANFLFTHNGKQLSPNAVRAEQNRAAENAGLGYITPHQLRRTYFTALINAGVSL